MIVYYLHIHCQYFVIVVVIYSVVVYYEVCSEAALIITVLWPFFQDNLDEQLPDMTLAYARLLAAQYLFHHASDGLD